MVLYNGFNRGLVDKLNDFLYLRKWIETTLNFSDEYMKQFPLIITLCRWVSQTIHISWWLKSCRIWIVRGMRCGQWRNCCQGQSRPASQGKGKVVWSNFKMFKSGRKWRRMHLLLIIVYVCTGADKTHDFFEENWLTKSWYINCWNIRSNIVLLFELWKYNRQFW